MIICSNPIVTKRKLKLREVMYLPKSLNSVNRRQTQVGWVWAVNHHAILPPSAGDRASHFLEALVTYWTARMCKGSWVKPRCFLSVPGAEQLT